MFLAGWNDASQGPLLPSLQEYYNVNYTVSKSFAPSSVLLPSVGADNSVSTIWVANFGGFAMAGIFNVLLTDRLGFGIVRPLYQYVDDG
jgi:fucose permease